MRGFGAFPSSTQRAARSAGGVRVNTFQHQRALITAKGQFVTTPNNDTLYSQAWLNLEKGPVTISVPASSGRYYCVPLMDMYSNNFAIVGTRTSGSSARTFTVVGPQEASNIPMAIRAPTNWVWVLGRTLVDGDSDLPKAHDFQDGWSIKGPEVDAPKNYATFGAMGPVFCIRPGTHEREPASRDGRPHVGEHGTIDPVRGSLRAFTVLP